MSRLKIVIAGTGEDISTYQSRVVNPDRFTWENRWIDEDERVRLFQQSSVVVLPYIEATQSGVVPNAYTFKKPVVATRILVTGASPHRAGSAFGLEVLRARVGCVQRADAGADAGG